ncbi:vitamin K epoxide reductase family protein [Candidatus Saccharibacteria bacterium]|nr:vitamin K epoxide reductase family protein [Candidatus Saccharibacteria bacterium]
MALTVHKNRNYTLDNSLPLLLLIGGLIGFIASFILTIETMEFLKNPSYTPSCNISPWLSCASVMKTSQASVFGFTNSLMGIAGFAVITTAGGALLAGARFKRWFWLVLQSGSLLGLVFVHWLFFESLYRIGALCPYCMVVWLVTLPIFWYITLYNIKQGYLPVPSLLRGIFNFARQQHMGILVLWFLIMIALIVKRFWYYFS